MATADTVNTSAGTVDADTSDTVGTSGTVDTAAVWGH